MAFSENFGTLSKKVNCLRYTVLALTVLSAVISCVTLGLCIWLKADINVSEWVDSMDLEFFYIGIYIMLLVAIVSLVSSCLGCLFVMNEHVLGLQLMVGGLAFKFLCCIVGAAVLLDYSTVDSDIQPMIRKSVTRLIAESHIDNNANTLRLIQENIGCCGADGPSDYLTWKKPLPTECRDTVTGNAFFHGCVDEVTWFLSEKSAWLSGIVMVLSFFYMLKAVTTIILVKAIKHDNS